MLLTVMLKRIFFTSTALVCLTLLEDSLTIVRGDIPDVKDREYHHKTVEIPSNQFVPSVNLVVQKDAIKGWNLEAKVSNFRFAPEHVNTASKTGEGHAHLSINKEKITRLYSSWYYLGNLKPGKNEITVSLNANTHESLAHNGKLIQDTVTIEVPATSNR